MGCPLWQITSPRTMRSKCLGYHHPVDPYVMSLYPHHSNSRLHHHQAETMHKMVETFEYDGEQFLACHTTCIWCCALSLILLND